jgi:hypothetical protein
VGEHLLVFKIYIFICLVDVVPFHAFYTRFIGISSLVFISPQISCFSPCV